MKNLLHCILAFVLTYTPLFAGTDQSRSRMTITLSQTGQSYSSNPVDYMQKHWENDENYVLDEFEAHKRPTFQHFYITEFSRRIANKLRESMDGDAENDCHLTVFFTVTEDGKVEDVHLSRNKNLNDLETRLVEIVSSADYWQPERHFRTKFATPMSIEVSASNFVPSNGVVLYKEDFGNYFEKLKKQLDKALPNSMTITLSQTGMSYSSSPVDYSYNPREGLDDDVLVEWYPYERLSFWGGDISELSRWIANKLIKSMDRDAENNCHLTIFFTMAETGKVEDVHVKRGKGASALETLLVETVSSAKYWYPENFYGTKFSTPMSIEVSASKFIPNNGVVMLKLNQGRYYEKLEKQIMKDKAKN